MTESCPSPGHLSAPGWGSFVCRASGKSEVAAARSARGQTMVKPRRISLTCAGFSTLALFWLLDYTHGVGRVSCRGAVLVWLGVTAGNGLVSGFVLKSHCQVLLVLKQGTNAGSGFFFFLGTGNVLST